MRQIINFILAVVLIFGGIIESKGQPNSLYFLKGVPQTKDLNPARPGIENGFYIGMPFFTKLDLSLNTNNWSYNDLIHMGSGKQKDSLVYDFKKYISALDNNNFINEAVSLTLLEFGWKKESNFFAFSWTEHEFSETFFTKNLVNLMYYGNVPYLGSTYLSGYFGVGAQHYREFAFTYAKDLNKKLHVGITGKLLFGLAGVKTTGLNVVAGMPISGDQIDMGATGKVFLSAPVDIQLKNNNSYQLLSGYQLVTNNKFSTGSYLSNFSNPGFAVDLGLSTQLSRKFDLSVSLIDFGYISWTKDVTVFNENGHFLFRGVNLNTPAPVTSPPAPVTGVNDLFLALRDSVRAAFYPNQTSSSFSTLLPVKLYVAGSYSFNENLAFGGLARVRMFNNMIHTSFTASVNAITAKNLSLSASYSIMEATFDNFGLAAAYKWRHIQIYAASDNVIAFANPTTARNANLRIGINLLFPDESKQRKGVYNRRPKRVAPGCPF